jgi:hypothetical protein
VGRHVREHQAMVHHQDLAAPAAVVLDADDVSFFERQQSASCGDRVPAAAAACKFKILAAIRSIWKYIYYRISVTYYATDAGFSRCWNSTETKASPSTASRNMILVLAQTQTRLADSVKHRSFKPLTTGCCCPDRGERETSSRMVCALE